MLNLLEYLEHSADRVPNQVAFSDETREFTFRQMLDFAGRVGTAVAKRLCQVSRPVVVLTDRTSTTLAAFQAVLAAGCYYAPVDVKMPPQRMEAIINQLHAPLLLYAPGQEKEAAAMRHLCPVLSLEEAEQTAADYDLLERCRCRVCHLHLWVYGNA